MAGDRKGYGYRPTDVSARDKVYPSEIAAQRPAFATKVNCPGTYEERDPCLTIRGDHGPNCYCAECMPLARPMDVRESNSPAHDRDVSDRVALMKRQLREG